MEHTTANLLPDFPPDAFVGDIRGDKSRSSRSFYTQVAKCLRFPDYFGRNLDALFDCLCALDDIPESEVVLLIHQYDQWLELEKPDKRSDTLAVLRDAENPENRTDDKRFRVYLLT